MKEMMKLSVTGTTSICTEIMESRTFKKFIENSVDRFLNMDWGDICEEDRKVNNSYPDCALGVYSLGEKKVWIKADRISEEEVMLTILYPEEY